MCRTRGKHNTSSGLISHDFASLLDNKNKLFRKQQQPIDEVCENPPGMHDCHPGCHTGMPMRVPPWQGGDAKQAGWDTRGAVMDRPSDTLGPQHDCFMSKCHFCHTPPPSSLSHRMGAASSMLSADVLMNCGHLQLWPTCVNDLIQEELHLLKITHSLYVKQSRS